MADYTVKSGDTLSQIAKAQGMTVKQLAEINGIKNVNSIMVGQELKLSAGSPDVVDEGLGVERTMSDEELQAKIDANQSQIDALKSRTLSDQAKAEVNEFINEKKAQLVAVGEAITEEVQEALDTCERELIAAYQKGEQFVEAAKVKAGEVFDAAVQGVKDAHNAPINLAESGARSIADAGKQGAKAVRDGLKMDVPEKQVEVKPDFSTMTKEEILAYQQEQVDALKNQSLTDKAKAEISSAIEDAEIYLKTGFNDAVDSAYETAGSLYNTLAKGAKAVFDFLRW